jgi:hypothetical protein
MSLEPRTALDILGIKITLNRREEFATASEVTLGSMFIGDDLISENSILDNTLYNESLEVLFFIKYNCLNYYQWFSVNFYDFKSKTTYQFYREFEMLYLKEFIGDNEIHVYVSFKDGVGNNFYFKLDEEEFSQVT